MDSKVLMTIDLGKFMLHERNLTGLPLQSWLNQRVKAKYCKNCHVPKIKNGFRAIFCKKLKKKNVLTINCLFAGLLFLLANKGKKPLDQFLDSDAFWVPNAKNKSVLEFHGQLKQNKQWWKNFSYLRLRQCPNGRSITFTLKKIWEC